MKSVPVRFYSIHIRSANEPVDYVKFFRSLYIAQRIEVEVTHDYTIVLDRAALVDNSMLNLVLLGGDQGGLTVFYDRREGGAVVEESTSERWTAKPTRVAISTEGDDRIVALEISRGGITAKLLENYLQRVPLDDFPDRRVDITPVAADTFVEELDAFERIRVASIEVSRPNFDWADHANSLYDLADESNAATSTAEVKAARGQSLERRTGLVGVIQSVVERPNSSIRNAKITGIKAGDTAEQTLSLSKHQERARAPLDQSLPLDDQSSSLLETFQEMLSQMHDRRGSSREAIHDRRGSSREA